MDQLRLALHRALPARFGVRGTLNDDTRLFSSGMIDSLSVIDLVSFFELETGLQVPPAEITLDNFDTINLIVRFAEKQASSNRPK